MPLARQLFLLLAALSVAACGDARRETWELSGSTMGTTFNIVLVAPADWLPLDTLEQRIDETLDHVDSLASTWRPDSELSGLNSRTATDWIDVSPEFCQMLEAALVVSEETGGAFDVTVGPLVNLWGFGPGREVTEPPSAEEIEAARSLVGYDGIQTDCRRPAVRKRDARMYVDLSGWAKGYAVDRVAELLGEAGASDFLVEIGGELRVSGRNAENRLWAIAIEAPATDRRGAQAIIRISDASVATSGDYRNYFEFGGRRYSHTIDARSGRPVTHELAAVTVVDPNAARADALATALLVLGPEDGPALAERLGIAGYFLVRSSAGIREIATTAFDYARE